MTDDPRKHDLRDWVVSHSCAGARVYLVENLEGDVELMPMSAFRPGYFLVDAKRWEEVKAEFPEIQMYEVWRAGKT